MPISISINKNKCIKILARGPVRGPSILGEAPATKLLCVVLDSGPKELSHFCLDKRSILPGVCQVNQTHAHRMSPAGEIISYSGSASQAAGETGLGR